MNVSEPDTIIPGLKGDLPGFVVRMDELHLRTREFYPHHMASVLGYLYQCQRSVKQIARQKIISGIQLVKVGHTPNGRSTRKD